MPATQERPSALMEPLGQQEPFGSRVDPGEHCARITWICAMQWVWSFGSGAEPAGQQRPVVVSEAAAQQLPLVVGTSPAGQQARGGVGGGRGGGGLIGWHWLLLVPPGDCPAGQHTPVEVAWPAAQQVVPVGTKPLAQQRGFFDPGVQFGGSGGVGGPVMHWPLLTCPLRQQANAPPGPG